MTIKNKNILNKKVIQVRNKYLDLDALEEGSTREYLVRKQKDGD